MFDPNNLQQYVDDAIANTTQVIPPDKKGALVFHVDETGQRIIAAEKLGDHWVASEYIDHSQAGGFGYGATLMTTW